jgi:hypothetical protein
MFLVKPALYIAFVVYRGFYAADVSILSRANSISTLIQTQFYTADVSFLCSLQSQFLR